VIFLVALFNGALLNQEKNLVEVPYLEGEMYGEGFAARYSDFTIRLQPKEYSNAYDAGQIMHQEPAGGSKVQKGSDLWLTVSMGEEPPVRKMDNFIGVELEEAKAVLENLGYTVLTRYESSFVYEAGLVTRTDPAAQTELTAGQTVYFYVSTGPSVVEAKMPNVVGMEASRAIELLEQLGFTSVKTEYVESQKPKNEVIYQSVESNTVIDVNTEITLLLSEGPKETEPETDPTETTLTDVPDETEPQAITVRVGIVVPIRDEDYALDVCIHGTKDVVTTKLVAAGSGNTTVELTGTGIMEFDLYIDGVYENTLKVKFNVD
ncbi:MAG: PASTA domain-containing protein, partial [Oscillospiraceae bacterium]|nr:PASTA domain-containing protein [Oscillospiraceae bacterium]